MDVLGRAGRRAQGVSRFTYSRSRNDNTAYVQHDWHCGRGCALDATGELLSCRFLRRHRGCATGILEFVDDRIERGHSSKLRETSPQPDASC